MDVRRILEIDRRFFEKYQRQLLWFVNTRFGRWYFRVQRHPIERRFTRFLAHALEWQNEDGSRTCEFRTADRYANRLKWTLRHVQAFLYAASLGWLARRQESVALSFLFAGVVTTFNPDANPETTTVDGGVYRTGSGVSWATIIAEAGNNSSDSASSDGIGDWTASNSSNLWTIIRRGVFLFDTSIIDSASTISAAVFSFWLSSKTAPTDANATKRELRLVSASPASNTSLTGTDFSTLGSTSYGTLAYASATAVAMNSITLNGDGIAHITKGGISKFGTRCGADIDGTAPTWGSFDTLNWIAAFAERSGTSEDPALEVTYTAAKTVSETVSMSDTQQKTTSRTYAETIGSSDTQTSILVKVKEVSDQASMSDSLGANAIGKNVVETVTMSDTVSKSLARTIIDIFTSSDSLSTQLTIFRTFLETVTMSDVLFFWRPRTRPSTSWGDRSGPSTSWADRTPPSTPWS